MKSIKKYLSLFGVLMIFCISFVACNIGSVNYKNSSNTTQSGKSSSRNSLSNMSYSSNISAEDIFICSYNKIEGITNVGKNLTTITIPQKINGIEITTIGEKAFENCTKLTTLIFGENIIYFGNNVFSSGCDNLEKVYYNGTINDWLEISFTSYYSNPLIIAGNLYINNNKVTNLQINNAYNVRKYAFAGLNCEEIVIGDNVEQICEYAFCTSSVRTVELGSNLNEIQNYAFGDCSKIVEIYNKSNIDLEIGESSNGGIAKYTLNIYSQAGQSKITTDSNGFIMLEGEQDKFLVGYKGLQTDITIPNSITKINRYAFCNTPITSVSMGNNVVSIGHYAFMECKNLSSITLSTNLKSINQYAFYNCNSLTSIVIPKQVEEIGVYAFSGCTLLSSVEFLSTNDWKVYYPNSQLGETKLSCDYLSDTQIAAKALTIAYCNREWVIA